MTPEQFAEFENDVLWRWERIYRRVCERVNKQVGDPNKAIAATVAGLLTVAESIDRGLKVQFENMQLNVEPQTEPEKGEG